MIEMQVGGELRRVSTHHVVIHLVIHVLSLAAAIFTVLSFLRGAVSFALLVSLVFLAAMLLSYPTVALVAQFRSTRRPGFLKWAAMVVVLGCALYLLTRFIGP